MIFIKHVRNKVKSYYNKEDNCYICGSPEDPEFHHLLCLSTESQKILRKQGYRDYPADDDPRFEELVWLVARDGDIMDPAHFYTLCKKCHKELHKTYGQNYIAWKPVLAYIEKQKQRHS